MSDRLLTAAALLSGGLFGRSEYERAFFGAEQTTDALSVGLDGGGHLIPTVVFGDRDDVIAHVVVPDCVAHLERAIGVSKLSGSVREANDQGRHKSADYGMRRVREATTEAGRRQLTTRVRPASSASRCRGWG